LAGGIVREVRIGEVAELAGVTSTTIRYYESVGLLAAPDRTASGYREYGGDAVARLQFIRDAQASGLSLAEIRSVLELKSAGANSCDHTRRLLERHLVELDEQIERLQAARTELAELARRASDLDPASCTDPYRCQVIAAPH
jgi:DNA-binding transcriptional MerR regulator